MDSLAFSPSFFFVHTFQWGNHSLLGVVLLLIFNITHCDLTLTLAY